MKLTKNLMSCQPLLGIPYKHSFNQVLSTIGNTRPGFRYKIKITFQNLLKYSLLRFLIKTKRNAPSEPDANISNWETEKHRWRRSRFSWIPTIPEWGHTTKQYVDDHTSTPNVTFLTIKFPQNFRCHVVRTSHYIRECFTCSANLSLDVSKLKITVSPLTRGC